METIVPVVALEERISFATPPNQEESIPLKPNSSNDLTQIVEDDYSVSGFVHKTQDEKHEYYSKDYVTEMRLSHLKERADDQARIDKLEQQI